MRFSTLLILPVIVFIGCAKKTALNEKPESAITSGLISSNSVGDEPLIGYADYNGTTTGGSGGSTVTVSSFSALQSALEGDTFPKIVYVSGAITVSGANPIYVKSNKSIIGLTGASVEGVSFQLIGSTVRNVIIQNLKISNYITYGAVTVSEGAHHVWVNHCEFSTDRNNGWDYYSKDIIVARGSDYVTISWNKFHDQYLSVLISSGISPQSEATDVGKLHVTLHHNYWYNISEREPTMNYGSVHMFNNYHLNNNGYSIGARAGGNVRTDNEYFSGCNLPISTNLAGDPPGYITGANTNIYVNCNANDITTTAGSWAPPYSYASALDAAANVPAVVVASAGTYTTTPPADTLQAENATLSNGAVFESGFSGFNGTGYVNPPLTNGSIQFDNVDGNGGGTKSIAIRYSLLSGSRTARLIINGGTPTDITVSSTGSWSTWATYNVNVTLNNNSSNTIRIKTNGTDWGMVDQIIVP